MPRAWERLWVKLLRINADGSIPSDNPFFTSATGINRAIWALGLRNPYTFAVQPGTGRIFIDDVGQNAIEEIDDGVAGANHGWPITEGPTGDPRFKSTIYFYDHSDRLRDHRRRILQSHLGDLPLRLPQARTSSPIIAEAGSNAFDPATQTVSAFASRDQQPHRPEGGKRRRALLRGAGDGFDP